jgi:hypothetical protein
MRGITAHDFSIINFAPPLTAALLSGMVLKRCSDQESLKKWRWREWELADRAGLDFAGRASIAIYKRASARQSLNTPPA